jgi:signal transduction histidine kinase
MSGNKGIFRVRREELNDFAEGRIVSITSISYGVNDGMVNRECNGGGEPAGWKTRDGKLWFPTVKGPVVVDPSRITLNPVVPPVVIEELLVGKAAVDLSRDVEISPGRGDLEIHYTAVLFAAPEKVRFKYLLEGYDEKWVEAGSRRIAYYTNIPPGRYTFRVIASNEEGIWSDSGAKLALYLRPHFYETGWFKALTLLTVIGLVALAYRVRLQKLSRAHATQQAFARQLIETQELERKRIAGELHDSVGQSLAIIRNLALVSLSTPDDHEQALEQLQEVSTAASEALVEVKAIAHNLRPYQLDRLGLSKALAAMVKSVADSGPILFTTEIADLDGLLSKEAEINLYRIVQESLNNIVQHSAATKASLVVKNDLNSIQIKVQDNGKGFAGNVGDPAFGGLGLIGIAERAKILGASCDISSVLGRGTTISITAVSGSQRYENGNAHRDCR